mmetsp:Transcript_19379/g.51465  ORF Transcript_19379/g.51465 Transcript_19379/m.51465 type:complete len:1118 (-) Transcript_19379:97-3450(-)
MPAQCFRDTTGDGAVNAVLFPAFSVMAGCLTTLLLRKYSGPVRLQYTVLLLILGIFLGAMGCFFNLGELEASFFYLVNMKPPEMFFYIFLPPLLFEGASGLEWYYVKHSMGQILFMAFVMVMVNTLATGLFVIHVLRVDWTLYTGLVFGALLSATDPVAVVAVLKSAGAPKSLRTVIEGESLLNDGSAFVLFEIFLQSVVDPSYGADSKDGVLLHILKETAHLTAGGIAVGLLFGMASAYVFSKTFKEQQSTISMSVALTYLVFYVAAATFGVSGPIAVVAFGFFMSAIGASYISPDVHDGLEVFWDVVAFVANTIVFFFSGIMGISIILEYWKDLTLLDWIYIPIIYLFLHLLRFGGLYLFGPVLNRLGYRIAPPERIVMSASGLRGALSLIMSLMVHYSMEGTPHYTQVVPRIALWTTGIAFMTLIINGSVIEDLMAKVGVGKSNAAQERMFFVAKESLQKNTQATLVALQNSSRFSGADWHRLYEYFGLEWEDDEAGQGNYVLTKSESKRALKKVSKGVRKMMPAAEPKKRNTTMKRGAKSFMITKQTEPEDGNVSDDESPPVMHRGGSLSIDEHSLRFVAEDNHEQDVSISFMDYFNKSNHEDQPASRQKNDDDIDMRQLSCSTVPSAPNLQTERRRRLLFSLRVATHKQFLNGLLQPDGLQVLTEVINRSLDQADKRLSLFDMMAGDVGSLNWFEKFLITTNNRIVNQIVMYGTFARLYRSVSTVAVYWSALLTLKKNWPKGEVYSEMEKEIASAADFLAHVQRNYPEVTRTIHTRLAALAVIRNQTKFVEKMTHNQGLLDSEAKAFLQATDELEVGLSAHFTLASAFAPLAPEDLADTIPFFGALKKEGLFRSVIGQGVTKGFNRNDEVLRSGQATKGIYVPLQGNVFSKHQAYVPTASHDVTENDALIVGGLGLEVRTFPVVGGIAGAYAALCGTPHQFTVYIESSTAVVLFIPSAVVLEAIKRCPNAKYEFYLVCAEQALKRLVPAVNFDFCHVTSDILSSDEDIDVLDKEDSALDEETTGNKESAGDVRAFKSSEEIAVYLHRSLRKTEILSLRPHEKKTVEKSVVGVVLTGSIRSKVCMQFSYAPALFSFPARTIQAGPSGAELLIY